MTTSRSFPPNVWGRTHGPKWAGTRSICYSPSLTVGGCNSVLWRKEKGADVKITRRHTSLTVCKPAFGGYSLPSRFVLPSVQLDTAESVLVLFRSQDETTVVIAGVCVSRLLFCSLRSLGFSLVLHGHGEKL